MATKPPTRSTWLLNTAQEDSRIVLMATTGTSGKPCHLAVLASRWTTFACICSKVSIVPWGSAAVPLLGQDSSMIPCQAVNVSKEIGSHPSFTVLMACRSHQHMDDWFLLSMLSELRGIASSDKGCGHCSATSGSCNILIFLDLPKES